MSDPRRPQILMAVYNTIEHDGRVLRAAETLASRYKVTLLCLHSGKPYAHPHFECVRIALTPGGRLRGLIQAVFWLRLVWLALRRRPDVVYAHDFYLPLAGLIAARLSGAALVYDAHELMIPEPGRRQARRDRFFYRLERLAVGRAEVVIAANEERAALMAEHYGLSPAPVVIRNFPPPPRPPSAERRRELLDRYPILRRDGRLRLVYQGDMSLDRGLEVFLRAVQRIADRCQLLLVGGGPDLEALRAMAGDSPAPDTVIVLGKVPRGELNAIIATGDLGIVTYPDEGLNNRYCASNKVLEYAQAGLPILATDQPPLQAAIAEYGIGVTCPREGRSPQSVAEKILLLREDLAAYRQRLAEFCRNHQWADEARRLLGAVAGELPPVAEEAEVAEVAVEAEVAAEAGETAATADLRRAA